MKKSISYSELNSGEINGAIVLEVTSIPDGQMIGELKSEEIENKSKTDFSTLLSEIYQIYNSYSIRLS